MISLLFRLFIYSGKNRFDNNNKDDYERTKKHQKTDKFKVDSI